MITVRPERPRKVLRTAPGPKLEMDLTLENAQLWASEGELRRRIEELQTGLQCAQDGRTAEDLQRYKKIFAASKDAIAVIAPDGTYLEQNEAHRRLLGYSDEELQAKTPAIHLGDEVFATIGAALVQDGVWRGEVSSRGKSGLVREIDLSAFTVKADDGRTICFVGIKRDVSEQRRAERALRKKMREQEVLYLFTDKLHRARSLAGVYAAALDAITSGLECQRASILLFDLSGAMRFVASHGLSAGYQAAVEGHSPWDVDDVEPEAICIDDVSLANLPAPLKAIVLNEGIAALAFIPLVSNGRLIGKFMVYYNSPHTFVAAELALALTIARQLAFGIEQKRAEQTLEQTVVERTAQLRDTVAELEAFSYSIAHDMRAPLRTMAGFSGILQDDYASILPAEAREYLRRIRTSAERLDSLIQDVLSYSKIGRCEMPLEVIDVEALTRSIIETYPHLQSGDVEITLRSPIPLVVGNPAGLTQCISNLLSNAVKFVAPGRKPRVEIWAEARSGSVRLNFKDNGIGTSEQGRRQIFQMFQRLNPAAEFEGNGIGLTIVRKSIERMHGRVGVESEVGQGSCFWLELKAVP